MLAASALFYPETDLSPAGLAQSMVCKGTPMAEFTHTLSPHLLRWPYAHPLRMGVVWTSKGPSGLADYKVYRPRCLSYR